MRQYATTMQHDMTQQQQYSPSVIVKCISIAASGCWRSLVQELPHFLPVIGVRSRVQAARHSTPLVLVHHSLVSPCKAAVKPQFTYAFEILQSKQYLPQLQGAATC